MVQKVTFDQPFILENGKIIPSVEVAYHTVGKLNHTKDNVVWVAHALTGNSDVSSWWQGLIGADKLFDPNQWFIVCANMLGSCYGTTGPSSVNEITGQKYAEEFPLITIRDMVKVHEMLADYLDIPTIHLAIGGSMGGQQILEWAASFPNRINRLVLLASNAFHSPWGIAFNEAQRMAIEVGLISKDPIALKKGLEAARAIGMLSYRNYDTFERTQSEDQDKLNNFKAASYQQYQGQKLSSRFDPYAYICLSKAMDSHHIGRARGGIEKVLTSIRAKTLIIGIKSDLLFPIKEQELMARFIPHASLQIMDSPYGHDGFLIEYQKITSVIKPLLQKDTLIPSTIYTGEILALPGSEEF
jgi:homoserine O-acetyltransferase/O-succinyltransferase